MRTHPCSPYAASPRDGRGSPAAASSRLCGPGRLRGVEVSWSGAPRHNGSGRATKGARKKGLLLVPEFPYDSFWSYRYIIRLIGRKAAFPPLGLLTFAGYLADDWDLELVDLH